MTIRPRFSPLASMSKKTRGNALSVDSVLRHAKRHTRGTWDESMAIIVNDFPTLETLFQKMVLESAKTYR